MLKVACNWIQIRRCWRSCQPATSGGTAKIEKIVARYFQSDFEMNTFRALLACIIPGPFMDPERSTKNMTSIFCRSNRKLGTRLNIRAALLSSDFYYSTGYTAAGYSQHDPAPSGVTAQPLLVQKCNAERFENWPTAVNQIRNSSSFCVISLKIRYAIHRWSSGQLSEDGPQLMDRSPSSTRSKKGSANSTEIIIQWSIVLQKRIPEEIYCSVSKRKKTSWPK